MQRYFIKSNQINPSIITIKDSDVHHIKNVMRMRLGDEVLCTDEISTTYRCQIEAMDAIVRCRIMEQVVEHPEMRVKLTIAQGLISREKTEEVIRRLVELGAKAYIPVVMRRSKIQNDRINYDRYDKIIKEAAEQSQRNVLMQCHHAVAFDELKVLGTQYPTKLVADLGTNHSLKDLLPRETAAILVVIGPEGGFDTAELDQLNKWGYQVVSLGNRTLRTETAPLFVASVCGYVYGDDDAN